MELILRPLYWACSLLLLLVWKWIYALCIAEVILFRERHQDDFPSVPFITTVWCYTVRSVVDPLSWGKHCISSWGEIFVEVLGGREDPSLCLCMCNRYLYCCTWLHGWNCNYVPSCSEELLTDYTSFEEKTALNKHCLSIAFIFYLKVSHNSVGKKMQMFFLKTSIP